MPVSKTQYCQRYSNPGYYRYVSAVTPVGSTDLVTAVSLSAGSLQLVAAVALEPRVVTKVMEIATVAATDVTPSPAYQQLTLKSPN